MPPDGYGFELCDLNDFEIISKLVKHHSPDAILHLAARTDLDGKTLQAYATNIGGVENLIGAIKESTSVKRCVFTSSQLVCPVDYKPINDLDYNPTTLYGESKVFTERIVRNNNGGDTTWCIARPTTIWGPGMSAHYQRLFRLIKKRRYFHVGRRKLYKSYGYVGNTVYQYLRFLEAPAEDINRKVFYVADYEPLSLREWVNYFADGMGAKRPMTIPNNIAKLFGIIGDLINLSGFAAFPYNSFRLKNVLTEYHFDLSDTEMICGPLPYEVNDGIKETLSWLLDADKI